jgi:hypothetical protein
MWPMEMTCVFVAKRGDETEPWFTLSANANTRRRPLDFRTSTLSVFPGLFLFKLHIHPSKQPALYWFL